MSDSQSELAQAAAIIEELVGLEHFEVIPMASRDPKVRLYGAKALREITIGVHPVVVADKRGVRLLKRSKRVTAWAYASEQWEDGIPPQASRRKHSR